MQPFDTPPNQAPLDARAINASCSCFSLRKATRAITQLYDHALEPTGIRSTQFNLLVTMASVSVRTLTEMAHVLVMDRTTLTRNLKPLETMGLIQTAVARDKRSKAYALTEKGRDTVRRAVPLWQNAQARVKNGLGDARFTQLNRELEALTRMIGEM